MSTRDARKGAIAYYIDHRAEMDKLFKEIDAEYEAQRAAAQAANPEWYAAIEDLLLIWEASTAEEWYDQVRYLPL